jgi:muramoyltetrapeptide carboxypeptidase LdcA involved in peptidoglycan recycling
MRLRKGDKIGISACSDAIGNSERRRIDRLRQILEDIRLEPVFSDRIFSDNAPFGHGPLERAEALMAFYRDPAIAAIFDISGGELANGILEHLDFKTIREHAKPLFGYSDMTPVLNAIWKETGSPQYLYQIRNLVFDATGLQTERFVRTMFDGTDDLYRFDSVSLQGGPLRGVAVGGNLQCLLKLAGTPYWPDLRDKVLFLEGLSAGSATLTTYFTQLRQMGVLERIGGLLLGTFTKIERSGERPNAEEIAMTAVGDPALPMAKTRDIGHGADSKCLAIGRPLDLTLSRG